MELPRQRRARKNKYGKDLYPLKILDIMHTSYPDKCLNWPENLETLFTKEEWIDILTRSRLSYGKLIKMRKLRTRKIK